MGFFPYTTITTKCSQFQLIGVIVIHVPDDLWNYQFYHSSSYNPTFTKNSKIAPFELKKVSFRLSGLINKVSYAWPFHF